MLATLAVVLLERARYARARYARSIVQRSLRSQAPQMAAICQQPNSRTRAHVRAPSALGPAWARRTSYCVVASRLVIPLSTTTLYRMGSLGKCEVC